MVEWLALARLALLALAALRAQVARQALLAQLALAALLARTAAWPRKCSMEAPLVGHRRTRLARVTRGTRLWH